MRSIYDIQKAIDGIYDELAESQKIYQDTVNQLNSKMCDLRKELDEAKKPKIVPAVRSAFTAMGKLRILVRIGNKVYAYKMDDGKVAGTNQWELNTEDYEITHYYNNVKVIEQGNFVE